LGDFSGALQIDVGYGNHSGLQQDIITLKPQRVPGTVEPLMVLVDNIGNREEQVNGLQYLELRLSVVLDY
jgi:hypothetical protein